MKTKYKYIEFAERKQSSDRAPYWVCTNSKNGGLLCLVEYYAPWRQFVISGVDIGVIFNGSCLRDIAEFLDQLNTQKKALDSGIEML